MSYGSSSSDKTPTSDVTGSHTATNHVHQGTHQLDEDSDNTIPQTTNTLDDHETTNMVSFSSQGTVTLYYSYNFEIVSHN